MPRVKLSESLKKAISGLSAKQKDTLLFRLVAGNPPLAEKLIFDLLEGGETQEVRRAAVAKEIKDAFDRYEPHFHTPGILLLLLRDLSGNINRHVKTTRDKYGEVELNLLMLNEAFERFGTQIRKARQHKAQTFNEYVVKRALKLLGLLDKMHEDIRLDFRSDLKQLGAHIGSQPTTLRVAEELMLDIKWLLNPRD